MEGSSDLEILNPVNEQLCRINGLPLECGHLSWLSIANVTKFSGLKQK